MCLSTVYAIRGKDRQPLLRNVASVRMQDGRLVFTDIMGIPTVVDAAIERIDLMDNYIYIRETTAPEAAQSL
ncbi:MAG: CooT family nickel-binding protein [Ruminococcaceae bacterium]|nr:CooT family nickel-binding protein [Oscillospiraceae bacterium]